MPQLFIVVVNYNGLEDTRKCLSSLALARTTDSRVVVVDNASVEDPSVQLRAEFPWCDVVRSGVNGGWAGGNNVGIRHALARGAEFVVLLNNDTVVTPDFAARLQEAAAAAPAFGILGPVIRALAPPHEVMTDGCRFNDPAELGFFRRTPVELGASRSVVPVDIVNGCCMLARAEVFRRIGLIDERFFLIHEETDFCLRALKAGFRCGVFSEALVWHKGSSTFKREGKKLQRYYDARNLALLLSRNARAHAGRRGPWHSRLEYLRHLYYQYVVERELGHRESADAVLWGFCDALSGRYGALPAQQPVLLAPLRWTFEMVRRAREMLRSWGTPKHRACAGGRLQVGVRSAEHAPEQS
jgi:GT2 family glycosyltransferase